jgi:hypothetical protein
MRFYKISGYASLFFGILATLSCFNLVFLFAGLLCAIVGFIFSILNIFISSKYDLAKKVFTKAHIGMLLCSVPVIYLLIIIFVMKN